VRTALLLTAGKNSGSWWSREERRVQGTTAVAGGRCYGLGAAVARAASGWYTGVRNTAPRVVARKARQ